MTHGKALHTLRELADLGFMVTICYGRCPCAVHNNTIGWSVQMYAGGGFIQVMEQVEAARSFEHCVEIAQKEADEYLGRMN